MLDTISERVLVSLDLPVKLRMLESLCGAGAWSEGSDHTKELLTDLIIRSINRPAARDFFGQYAPCLGALAKGGLTTKNLPDSIVDIITRYSIKHIPADFDAKSKMAFITNLGKLGIKMDALSNEEKYIVRKVFLETLHTLDMSDLVNVLDGVLGLGISIADQANRPLLTAVLKESTRLLPEQTRYNFVRVLLQ